MATNLAPHLTRPASLRGAMITIGLVTAIAATWTASGQAFAYTDSTPVTSPSVNPLVSVQLNVRPLGAPDAGYSERHQYGVARTITTSTVVLVSDTSKALTHPSGDTAMHFRYGRVDSY